MAATPAGSVGYTTSTAPPLSLSRSPQPATPYVLCGLGFRKFFLLKLCYSARVRRQPCPWWFEGPASNDSLPRRAAHASNCPHFSYPFLHCTLASLDTIAPHPPYLSILPVPPCRTRPQRLSSPSLFRLFATHKQKRYHSTHKRDNEGASLDAARRTRNRESADTLQHQLLQTLEQMTGDDALDMLELGGPNRTSP